MGEHQNFLKELGVVSFDVAVQLMADLAIIYFNFLFFGVVVPVEHPVVQGDFLELGKIYDLLQPNRCPDTISAHFYVLSFLQRVYFPRHRPSSLLIFLTDSCMSQGLLFGLILL